MLQTKSSKQNSPPKKPNHRDDDSRWIKKVIQQEHIKPLEVSKDYVLDYEKSEKVNQERLTSQVHRHINTLQTLRVKLEARQDLKERTEEYRSWQKGFAPKKQAVMNGKTLDDIDASGSFILYLSVILPVLFLNDLPSLSTTGMMIGNNGRNSKNNTMNSTQRSEDPRDAEINDLAMSKVNERTLQKQGKGSNQELSTVLDSLSRLAELEHRITSLEKENQYDNMLSMEKPAANQRTSIEFLKKRGVAEDRGPVGMVYEIRPKNQAPGSKNWKVSMPGVAGGGSAAVRAKQRGQADYADYEDEEGSQEGGGPGIFITADETGGAGAAKR